MREKLEQFLRRHDGKLVEWGVDDCSACPHAWLRENGIGARIPTYSSREEARTLIAAAGGLVELWDDCLLGTGIAERLGGAPELGDIAVIDTRRLGPVGVICGAGGLCCWRKDGGFFWLAPRGYLKVWAVS
ncbi:MAG TPA: hypothetical protein VNS34_10715 [Rhizobiaceae bacterium]|nr:hypothetical protein [Rhizobiaceae bacterium]